MAARTAFQTGCARSRRAGAPAADAREGLARDFQSNSERNEYLLNRLLFKYEYNEDVNDVFNMQPYYQQITGAAMRDAARMYLNTNRYVKVTLMPESQTAVAR